MTCQTSSVSIGLYGQDRIRPASARPLFMFPSDSVTSSAAVIIPAYEPPAAFPDYVRQLTTDRRCSVLVVDDGSGEKFDSVFLQLSEIPGCTVLRYPDNHGKGYALKYAFAYCKDHFAPDTVFATADCDGQHAAHDVLNCLDAARRSPGALVLGVRDFSRKDIPSRNRSGNLFTRRLFRLLYGISVSDTQTGLRAFTYGLLSLLLGIRGDRFEYEMNMLICLHKEHIPFHEVSIDTIYNQPSEAGEKVSHFKPLRDSAKVIGILVQNLGWYMISSVLSAVADVLLFYFLTGLLFDYGGQAWSRAVAVVGARVLSSVINFTLNFKFVFQGKSKSSVIRYYCLWIVQLGLSYSFTYFVGRFITAKLTLTLLKGGFDLLLALASYQIQRVWVFPAPVHRKHRFYGFFFRFVRFFGTLFTGKYACLLEEPNEPTVFVARHMNLKGPLTLARSLRFDTHMMAFSPFFAFDTCYRQYADFTFTARNNRKGIGRFFGKIGAFFAALAVPPLMRSMAAIPVYRKGTDSLVTFRRAIGSLERNESVLLFPDVDYTADRPGEIYHGFLYLEKMWFAKHGTHLNFSVIAIDRKSKEISVRNTFRFDDGADFATESERIAGLIGQALS